jgi:hypothetical protein
VLLNSKIVMLNNVTIIAPFVHVVMSTTCVVMFTITCAFTLTLVVGVAALDDLEQSCITSCAMIHPKFAL